MSTKKKLDFVMVAAIDFGTTYSGYAFAMKNKSDIKMNKNWGAEFGSTSYKTPTSVLVDPEKKFCAFGYNAQKQYAELKEKEDQEYYYFEKFKMALHNKKDLSMSTMIKATNGKSMPALEIFAMALCYLKDHLIETVNKTVDGKLDGNMIRWVITVPAIWSNSSKQFMREAALKGGLIKKSNSDCLLIALEPEAASLCVRKMDIGVEQNVRGIKCGTKYLVIDAGGGTLDVTCHELQSGGKIKELYFATGGPYGGGRIDDQFERLLCDIFDSKFITNFKLKNASQWLQLMTDFEKRKKACEQSSGLKICIPWSFASSLVEFSKQDVGEVVKKYGTSGVSFNNGMLRLDADVTRSLFKPVTDDIKRHIEELLKNPKMRSVEYLFCVGGFNDSKILQGVMQQAFGEKFKIVIAEEASLAVVKGAVMYGQDPNTVTSRVSAKTYGTKAGSHYIPFVHDPSKVSLVNGHPMCFDIFRKFVLKGAEVPVGSSETISFSPLTPTQSRAIVNIYSSEDTRALYVTDPGVEEVGKVSVKWPGEGLDRQLDVTMVFGGTEIKVEAVTYPGQQRRQTKISFLSK